MNTLVKGWKRNFLNVVKEDIQEAVVTESDAEDRLKWKQMNCCGDLYREKLQLVEEKACSQLHCSHFTSL